MTPITVEWSRKCCVREMSQRDGSAPSFQLPAPLHWSTLCGKVLAGQWCAACHDAGISSSAVDVAPPFATIAADAAWTDDRLAAFLTLPHGQIEHFSFTETEIDNLVAHIRTLSSD